MSKAPPTHERLEYMQWVTDNVDTFVKGQNNVVACVYCKKIYETKYVKTEYNCLWCKKCGIDALMVVKHSPLHCLTEPEQRALLDKWHAEGFTPITRGGVNPRKPPPHRIWLHSLLEKENKTLDPHGSRREAPVNPRLRRGSGSLLKKGNKILLAFFKSDLVP